MNLASWFLIGFPALVIIACCVEAKENARGASFGVTIAVASVLLLFSCLRGVWLEPVLAGGPAFLKIVSLVALLINFFMVVLVLALYHVDR